MKHRAGFTLIEIVVVVTIIAIVSTFSVSAWRGQVVKAEFDDAVLTILSVFQGARDYAISGVTVDDNMNSSYTVAFYNTADSFSLDGDVSGLISSYSFDGIAGIDGEDWTAVYSSPYGECVTSTREDISFVVSSLKGGLNKTIVVHNLSGIAEIQ
ncbi:MAG: prepilin-type N-terminal cleavage/methylation domain-containing protein [Patescibacteria group bacterium]|nr:prepilin-type N-terminal cleavage/methylation domain-containing protein [Patescibacteria group bacterium]